MSWMCNVKLFKILLLLWKEDHSENKEKTLCVGMSKNLTGSTILLQGSTMNYNTWQTKVLIYSKFLENQACFFMSNLWCSSCIRWTSYCLWNPQRSWENMPSHKNTVGLETLLLLIPGFIYLYTSSLYEWVIPAAWRWRITMQIRIYLFLFPVLLIHTLRQTMFNVTGLNFSVKIWEHVHSTALKLHD